MPKMWVYEILYRHYITKVVETVDENGSVVDEWADDGYYEWMYDECYDCASEDLEELDSETARHLASIDDDTKRLKEFLLMIAREEFYSDFYSKEEAIERLKSEFDMSEEEILIEIL